MSDPIAKFPITFPARVVKHDTKGTTTDGVSVLRVTCSCDCLVGGEAIQTAMTFAFRSSDAQIEQFPLNDSFEITIRPKTK